MFKKDKYPLRLFSIISLVFVALTIIFVSIFGVNTSIEIGGGSQIEVKLSYSHEDTIVSGRENATEYVEVIEDVLATHDCNIDSYFVEDKLTDTYLVVRIAKTQIKNADTIASQIASELGIDQARVSGVQSLSSYFTENQMLYIGLAILVLLVICFFVGWLRYTIIGGITLMFSVLHSLILSLSLIFLYRVQFSIISLVTVLALTVLSLFALICILERARENTKSVQFSNLTEDQKLISATKQTRSLLLPAGVILLLAIVLICVPISYIQLAGVGIILSLIASVYTAICISPALHAYLSEIHNAKEKQKLSKNVTTNKK